MPFIYSILFIIPEDITTTAWHRDWTLGYKISIFTFYFIQRTVILTFYLHWRYFFLKEEFFTHMKIWLKVVLIIALTAFFWGRQALAKWTSLRRVAGVCVDEVDSPLKNEEVNLSALVRVNWCQFLLQFFFFVCVFLIFLLTLLNWFSSLYPHPFSLLIFQFCFLSAIQNLLCGDRWTHFRFSLYMISYPWFSNHDLLNFMQNNPYQVHVFGKCIINFSWCHL